MKIVYACSFLLLVSLCLSCNKQYTFSQSQSIPEEGWTYQNVLKYDFVVSDTKSLYNLYLKIEYLTSFAYQNVYVNVSTGQEEAKMKKTQLSLDLSNSLGVWNGHCDKEQCTYLMPLQESIFFERTGKQLFWIEQFSRNEKLKGIQSITLVGDKIGERPE